MDSINTVNFEDLFDFSPEPAPGHASGASGGVEDEAQEKLRTTNTSQSIETPESSSKWWDASVKSKFDVKHQISKS